MRAEKSLSIEKNSVVDECLIEEKVKLEGKWKGQEATAATNLGI